MTLYILRAFSSGSVLDCHIQCITNTTNPVRLYGISSDITANDAFIRNCNT